MSKIKRLLAAAASVIMVVSMLAVFTFAATPVFARDWVDPAGAITKDACLVDSTVASYIDGTPYTASIGGKQYEFTVGQNVFSTFDKAVEGADMFSSSGDVQIILSSGKFGDIIISKPMDIFGVNYNTNPNTVDPNDPTQPWTETASWSLSSSVVNNIVVSEGVTGTVNVWGVEIAGRVYDSQRQISSIKTKLVMKNILFAQTVEGIAVKYTKTSGRAWERYAMTFYNANSKNHAENGARNSDELFFINWRFKSLAGGECTRLIDEMVPPQVTFDGCYMPGSFTNFESDQGWWMKWGKCTTNCKFSIINSYLSGISNANTYCFEGYTDASGAKLAVGGGGEDQYSEFIMRNNVLFNARTDDMASVQIYANSFSKIDISNNIVISSSGTNASDFIWISACDETKDLSNVFTLRDNTIIGYSKVQFEHGNNKTKVDMTGTYWNNSYNSEWQNGTSDLLPKGNVRYDYCYMDAARTKKTSDIPDFKLNGVSPNADNSITVSGAAGNAALLPIVSGITKYDIYSSDANFSNISDYEKSEPVNNFTLKNTSNYFIFVAYSYDHGTTVPYKVTVNKPATSINFDLNVNSEVDYAKNGLEFNVGIKRIYDSLTFGIDSRYTFDAVIISSNGNIQTNGNEVTVSDIITGEPTVVRLHVTDTVTNVSDFFYVNVTREYNKECSIISADGINISGLNATANIPGDKSEYTFKINISDGATAAAWRGTSVYAMNAEGYITVRELVSGVNTFTLGVTAENKTDVTLYTLTIDKAKNNEAKVYAIEGAVQDGEGFTATARTSFKVNPTVSLGATYKVYADAACTKLIENNTVSVVSDTTVYIVVTSESGTSVSNPIALNIKKSNDGIVVAGETVDKDNALLRILKHADNLTEVKLNITANNATYKLYADKKLSVECSDTVKLDASVTYVYAKVLYNDGESDVVTIKLISNRTAVKYSDVAAIPTWAKQYIDKLNNNGTGILKGDSNGKFNASNSMTRYEIAAIAVRLLGVDASQFAGVSLSYTDEIAGWALNYVKAVTKLGIMSGSNDANGKLVFGGSSATTRSQLAKIIVELSFLDNGITTNVRDYYTANQAKVDSKYASFGFVDEDSVQTWAKPYVRLAVYAEYFSGALNNCKVYINGKANIKRSEIAAVITRYLGM